MDILSAQLEYVLFSTERYHDIKSNGQKEEHDHSGCKVYTYVVTKGFDARRALIVDCDRVKQRLLHGTTGGRQRKRIYSCNMSTSSFRSGNRSFLPVPNSVRARVVLPRITFDLCARFGYVGIICCGQHRCIQFCALVLYVCIRKLRLYIFNPFLH